MDKPIINTKARDFTGWRRHREMDSGRRRVSGLEDDHDAAGGLDSLISPSLTPGAITIAGDPGVCPSCGGKINPLTYGCRC